MSGQVLPPNPSLVAIILVIRTRQGVKHIYHYPPSPGEYKPQVKLDYEHSSEEGSSSEASYSSVEDDEHVRSDEEGKTAYGDDSNPEESSSASPEKIPVWEKSRRNPKELLGLPLGFASFLCPPSLYHKKRFELTIGKLTFLGWPCFARDNGDWKRRSKTIRQQRRRMSTISEQKPAKGLQKATPVEMDEELGETTGHESIDENPGTEGAPSNEGETSRKIETAVVEEEEERKGTRPSPTVGHGLSMFHVIFVMNPHPLEYQVRVDEMYKHVVKKFSRALKWEQARSNYVLRECEKLKSMKARHDPSSPAVLKTSPLASAIATLYTSISTSRIAHIDLSPSLSFSLQIPIPTSISHLPNATAPQLPGLWLTTSIVLPPDSDFTSTTRTRLASHFALLLLSDPTSILSDLTPSSPLAAPLAHYLHYTLPTKSFLQISQSSGIGLEDIYFLASHLIYWRCARAIPPLHQRDVYVVSPNADLKKLKSSSVQYAKLFPNLPPMTKMLGGLARGDRPYRALIPGKERKVAYMEVLAWLMRGGWVTQLRTFAWVRVGERVQAQVIGEVEREKRREKERERDGGRVSGKGKGKDAGRMVGTREGSRSVSAASGRISGGEGEESEAGDMSSSGYLTPMQSSTHSLAPSAISSAASTSSHSSVRTAIPLGLGPHSGAGESLIASEAALKQYRPKLIKTPSRASGLEARYLECIAAEIEKVEGTDSAEAWNSCLGFFDGQHALETIAVREGWKRKRVESLRAGWVRMGVLVEVRHW